MTCSMPQRNVHRRGIEPGTPWSEIRRPIHCATPPLQTFTDSVVEDYLNSLRLELEKMLYWGSVKVIHRRRVLPDIVMLRFVVSMSNLVHEVEAQALDVWTDIFLYILFLNISPYFHQFCEPS